MAESKLRGRAFILSLFCVFGVIFILVAFLAYPVGNENVVEGQCLVTNRTLFYSKQPSGPERTMEDAWSPLYCVDFFPTESEEHTLLGIGAVDGSTTTVGYYRSVDTASSAMAKYSLGETYPCIHGDNVLTFQEVLSKGPNPDNVAFIDKSSKSIKRQFVGYLTAGVVLTCTALIGYALLIFDISIIDVICSVRRQRIIRRQRTLRSGYDTL